MPKSVLNATRVIKVTLFEITFKTRSLKQMVFKKDTELNECYRLERISSRNYTLHFFCKTFLTQKCNFVINFVSKNTVLLSILLAKMLSESCKKCLTL